MTKNIDSSNISIEKLEELLMKAKREAKIQELLELAESDPDAFLAKMGEGASERSLAGRLTLKKVVAKILKEKGLPMNVSEIEVEVMKQGWSGRNGASPQVGSELSAMVRLGGYSIEKVSRGIYKFVG